MVSDHFLSVKYLKQLRNLPFLKIVIYKIISKVLFKVHFFPSEHLCREVPERYQLLQAIGSGAYGLVW